MKFAYFLRRSPLSPPFIDWRMVRFMLVAGLAFNAILAVVTLLSG